MEWDTVFLVACHVSALCLRRIYNWFSYVLFFYNGFAGLVGAAVRIVYATLFSLLLLFRLDTVALPKQLWWWDFGELKLALYTNMHCACMCVRSVQLDLGLHGSRQANSNISQGRF